MFARLLTLLLVASNQHILKITNIAVMMAMMPMMIKAMKTPFMCDLVLSRILALFSSIRICRIFIGLFLSASPRALHLSHFRQMSC